MTMTDPIADLLTRIRNAQSAGHKKVRIPASNMKEEIVKILVDEGFVMGYEIDTDGKFKEIEVTLKYYNKNKPVILGLKKISKPGRRVYVGSKNIPRVRNNFGIAILSTSMGMLTGTKARKLGVGGELICNVW